MYCLLAFFQGYTARSCITLQVSGLQVSDARSKQTHSLAVCICIDRKGGRKEGRKEGRKISSAPSPLSFASLRPPPLRLPSPPSTMTASLRSSLHGLALGQSASKPKPKPADAAPELERIIVGIDFGYVRPAHLPPSPRSPAPPRADPLAEPPTAP